MGKTCCCSGSDSKTDKKNLPVICMIPRDSSAEKGPFGVKTKSKPAREDSAPHFLDEEYIKKNFKLPQRALYLDHLRRPLITFPMTQERTNHFNLARKTKINQQILDGSLDASEAITSPSVFPYGKSKTETDDIDDDEDSEVIYILQLPDWETECPVHKTPIKTPRFIWHSCKKTAKKTSNEPKRGGGPLNKPKPWLLSRHTDFDLLSQW